MGVRLVGVGDEDFPAVYYVVVPVGHRRGLGAARVAAGVGLGQGESAQLFALCQRNEIFFLLRLGPIRENGPGPQGGVRGEDYPGSAVHPGELLHRDGIAHHVKAHAAVLLRIRNSHQSQLAQLPDGLAGKRVLLVQQKGQGLHFRFRELPDKRAQSLVIVCGPIQHRSSSLQFIYLIMWIYNIHIMRKKIRCLFFCLLRVHHLRKAAAAQAVIQRALDFGKAAVDVAAGAVLFPPGAFEAGLHAGTGFVVPAHDLYEVEKAHLTQIGRQPAAAVGSPGDGDESRVTEFFYDFIGELLGDQLFPADLGRRLLLAALQRAQNTQRVIGFPRDKQVIPSA
ncbi:hypothetical protein SDC9_143981 [bioreactor metagenome]|uniref:Uncharacterized protein n=1 Tax=bioreactor metagenome TaxID=1076179 RepID=A0A645E5M5_9ZZZZ